MPALPQRSDAADRRSLSECRNRRMGRLVIDAISYAPVLAQAFLSPRSAQKSVSVRFGQRKECPYRSADAVFFDFPHYKHILRVFLSSIPSHRDTLSSFLSNAATFQNT